MRDHVSLSATHGNLHDCIKLAAEHELGIELMTFAYSDVLDGDWAALVAQYRDWLKPVTGTLSLHGPFIDMASGSPDAKVNAVCYARYEQAIRIAGELGASIIVLHANFIGTLQNAFYREGWHARNVEFYNQLAVVAQQHDVIIAMENMWEFDPTIIADLLAAVHHPNLRACLDVGHAHLFSDRNFSFNHWLQVMAPWLVELHMNNNNGVIDEHHGFDWQGGVLDYHSILAQMRALEMPLNMVLEMQSVEDMASSLHYFRL